ncbi:MAG: response regulator [Pseudomonadota bacterium]
MSLAEQISPHLPYLRRYARALTGNQESGDKYVGTLLEALVEDPDTIAGKPDMKVALFGALSSIWSSVGVNLDMTDAANPADRKVTSLTPRARQAFLLTALEGFSPKETATILEANADEVSQLVTQAGNEIAEQVGTSVLIIEDEPLIALDIEQMVVNLGHSVTGIARTHTEAVAAVREQKPGLVLADIQLADGSSGIDAVKDILETINVPVIFITAFPERLLTGERPEPAFLVTKPFHPDMVRALISQALFFEQNAGNA